MAMAVEIIERATSAARIKKQISKLAAHALKSPSDATSCRRHIKALKRLVRPPRDLKLNRDKKIIGGGGKKASLGELDWHDATKSRAKKKGADSGKNSDKNSSSGKNRRAPRQ